MLNDFNLEKYFSQLSEKKIESKLVFYFFAIVILTLPISSITFDSDLVKIIRKILEATIYRGITVYMGLALIILLFFLISLTVYALGVIIFNWIVKLILRLFHLYISFYKLTNIFLFSIVVNRFLGLAMFIMLAVFYPFVKNIPRDDLAISIAPVAIMLGLIAMVIYCYGIKIIVKKVNLISGKARGKKMN